MFEQCLQFVVICHSGQHDIHVNVNPCFRECTRTKSLRFMLDTFKCVSVRTTLYIATRAACRTHTIKHNRKMPIRNSNAPALSRDFAHDTTHAHIMHAQRRQVAHEHVTGNAGNANAEPRHAMPRVVRARMCLLSFAGARVRVIVVICVCHTVPFMSKLPCTTATQQSVCRVP